MEKIKVLLVEDHVLVREGIRELLSREDDLQVVAEAGDGEEAVQLAVEHRPDVVIMDIAMPKLNGLEATKRIKAVHPAAAVLVLTAYDDDQHIFAFLEAGAVGYVLKDISANDLIKTIRTVHAGESVLHPAIARKVTDYFARRLVKQDAEEREISAFDRLTRRETEILKLTAQGMTNREIADALTISLRTVQSHLSNIYSKLGVDSRMDAVLYALREGRLALEDIP